MFQNSADKKTAVDDATKVIRLKEAISDGYHVSPTFLGISKYTCRRCYHLVSKNLFKGDPDIFSMPVSSIYQKSRYHLENNKYH